MLEGVIGFFQENAAWLIAVAVLVGLCIGSFLNVVIYRLPVMMKKQWRSECYEFLELEEENEREEAFNLNTPRSHCPGCKTQINAWDNIPIISYLLLRGRCANNNCGTKISLRYPLIEMITGVLSGFVAFHFGVSAELFPALVLTWALVALTMIDVDHMLLPDSIVMPLLWLGLLLASVGITTEVSSSVYGAVAGYLSLWSIFHIFRLLTGKEGMGYGDFKLLALFGAWMGWQMLLPIVLLSSVVGAIVGITLIILTKKGKNQPIPFGPYLAVAGWTCFMWGDEIIKTAFPYLA